MAEINAALVEGAPIDEIVDYTGLSHGSVHRHAKGHLPAAIVKAAEVKAEIREVASAATLLDRLKVLEAKAMDLLSQAEAAGEIRDALAGIREARATLEVIGRVTRELGPSAEVAVTVAPASDLDLKLLSTYDLKELERITKVARGELPPTFGEPQKGKVPFSAKLAAMRGKS